jgi:hypothetical protein
MATATLDAIDGVSVESGDYFNECRTIQMLSTGLLGIANHLKRREAICERQTAGKIRMVSFGLDFDGTKDHLDQIACTFHWFGVSLCNYARLVGFIRGISTNRFKREDLTDSARFRHIRDTVGEYVRGIPELTSVLVWRHKVGAHFAITSPKEEDNPATLDMSVMFPVSFSDGRYRVGEFTLSQTGPTGTHTAAIPCWSVTEVFESLMPRYWPTLNVKSIDEANRSTDPVSG